MGHTRAFSKPWKAGKANEGFFVNTHPVAAALGATLLRPDTSRSLLASAKVRRFAANRLHAPHRWAEGRSC